jgi:hypothetical protein
MSPYLEVIFKRWIMIYFVKRNQKIREYKKLYDLISKVDVNESLHSIYKRNSEFKPLLEKYYTSEESILNSTRDEILSNSKELLSDLKSFEPYQSRIRFDLFHKMFNFEKYLYFDKTFRYYNLSKFNKRIIPDYVSTVITQLIVNGFISKNIRRYVEQYIYAAMSDMDYINYSNTLDFVDIFDKNNLFVVIGSIPATFSVEEKHSILKERINTFDEVKKIVNFDEDYLSIFVDDDIVTGSFHQNSKIDMIKTSYDLNKRTGKDILINLRKRISKYTEYNLVVITSTFNLQKCAIEIEKNILREGIKKPMNVLIIGKESIYDQIKSNELPKVINNPKLSILEKKKLKSLLYELMLHSLDKNFI